MQRRQFLTQVAAGAAALSSAGGKESRALTTIGNRYPYRTVSEAFHAASFDPTATDSAYFVVAADCHYGMNTGDGLLPVIKEINQLDPRPEFFLVNGDMAVTASLSFGRRPNKQEKLKTIDEFNAFRKHAEQLDPAIPLKLTLGNHDTHPGEDEPELFHEVFPEFPAYESFNLAGGHFVLLNGHSDGRIDSRQSDWFAADIAGVDRDQEIITFVHQPSLGSSVRERMIAPAYENALVEHRGIVWAICGHEHRNHDQVFQLPHTTINQATVVCSAPGIWGGPEKPGYWYFLMQGGKIVNRVFRSMEHGFRLKEQPDSNHAVPIPKPFQFAKDVRWKTLVGEGDEPYRIEHDANDNVTCWCYVRKLVYGLPLKDTGASRLAVLGSFKPSADGTPKAAVRVSGDRKSWHDLKIPLPKHGVYEFVIPGKLRTADTLYAEVARLTGQHTEIYVAGYALLA
ncbi:metallophosphoesterase family protein [Adhaeretor mobilis]|uniref:Calcineurin-like phosphoesterase n=1 Tax=Adhaeretor mobilis TaxID=1930276 RepID=A0A517MZR2_9BACT|nr:metallophosphoesterase [Adhaeretor mobilis]QDT00369.1 Calcineurin-like phosphoesterase [Adhaeretor mobilis]